MNIKKFVPKKIKKIRAKIKKRIKENKKQLTLKKICNIIGVEIPSDMKKLTNKKASIITRSRLEIEPNFVLFCKTLNGFDEETRKKMKENALCIFSEEPISDCNNIVITRNLYNYSKIMIYIRKIFNPYIITVTGSIGKTSTKDVIASVLKEKYKKDTLFASQGNSNSHFKVAKNIKDLTTSTKVFLQEVGIGGDRALIKQCAIMLEPNIAVYTNILDAHIEHYKTRENIAKYKTLLSKYGKQDGLAIINYDDPVLRKVKFEQEVISYSLNNKKANYYAKNIKLTGEGTTFTIIDNIHNEEQNINLKVIGEHHIYNSLAAYAVGKYLDIKPEKIAKGLSKYKTTGMRGNLFQIGDYKIFADCYNASLDSIESSAKTMDLIKLDKKSKKLAVIGDVKELGEISEETHRQIGKNLAKHDIQVVIFFGEEIKYAYEAYNKVKKGGKYFNDRLEMHKYIEKEIKPGDLILFKGSHKMHLTDSIDMIFGTNMSDQANIGEADYKLMQNKNYEFYQFPCQTSILKYFGHDKKLIIPETLEGQNVTKLWKSLFENNKEIKEIILPKNISIIKPMTFKNSSLEKITLNEKLKGICNNAFCDCKNLKEIKLPESLIYIEYLAFANCKNLEKVYIPSSIQRINKNAFKNSNNVTIYAKKGSVGEKFAKENNINFKIWK